MKCRLCKKEAIDDKLSFCNYHDECYKKIEIGFEKWHNAYGILDWLTYLRNVSDRSETGVWAKEYCNLLLKENSEYV